MRIGFIVPAVAAFAIAVPVPASAAEVRPFDARAFAAAQAQGRPILVDVYADWCPVCRAQQRIIGELLQDRAFNNLIVFKLNFDTQRDDWRRFGVRRQSTLIAFNGRTETGRVVGDTNRASLAQLLRASLR